MIKDLEKDLNKLKNPKQAKTLSGFFKNNNNIFYGIYAKDLKNLVNIYYPQLTLQEITELLKSNIQEKKQLACYALIQKYVDNKEKIFNFYLKNLRFFNDWALIDTTCINIVGDYLIKKDKKIIYTLARSSKWNEKRISIVSCLAFIRQNDFTDILKISKSLIQDENDLIQKAIGWMLREVGKRDKDVLLDFLNKNIKKIKRITLRYALEKFPKQERDYWYANKNIYMNQKQTFYFYMDDSGARSLNKNNFIRKDKMDYFALGGILVKEEDKEIVKNKYIEFCNKWDIKDPLHSTKIRGEREEYGWLKQNKTNKALFMNDLDSLLINIPVIGFAAVIDRKGYVDRYKQKYKEKLWAIDKTVYCILIERIIKYIKPLNGIIEIRFEETGKKEDRSILQYTEDLKKYGTPFDKNISSKKYNRLKNIDFKSNISMRIKRKKKANLFVQIADLYLYPMAKSGYDPKYKAWVNLFKNKKVINALVSIKTRSKLGIKYSCFSKRKDPE